MDAEQQQREGETLERLGLDGLAMVLDHNDEVNAEFTRAQAWVQQQEAAKRQAALLLGVPPRRVRRARVKA